MNATVPAPTKNERLLAWVEEVAALTEPDAIHWCDGIAEEYDRLCAAARRRRGPSSGSPTPSDRTPTWRCRTPATSRASRTAPSSAPPPSRKPGPTNNWRDPAEMRKTLIELFAGSMRGPHDVRRAVLDGPARLGQEPGRRAAHRLDLRRGLDADHDADGPGRPGRARRDGEFVPCLHSVGMPLADGAAGRARGPATPRTSTSSTSPRPARSGPTARATAATRCSARSASRCGSPP